MVTRGEHGVLLLGYFGRLVLLTLVLGTHVCKSYSASTLVLFFKVLLAVGIGAWAPAQLNLYAHSQLLTSYIIYYFTSVPICPIGHPICAFPVADSLDYIQHHIGSLCPIGHPVCTFPIPKSFIFAFIFALRV